MTPFWVLLVRALFAGLFWGLGAAAVSGVLSFAGLIWLDRRLAAREAVELAKPVVCYVVPPHVEKPRRRWWFTRGA